MRTYIPGFDANVDHNLYYNDIPYFVHYYNKNHRQKKDSVKDQGKRDNDDL